jgi:hypothetical protein
MTRHRHAVVAALAAVLALATRVSAQQPAEQRRVDSLAAEVRALKARLDSLRAQVGRAGAAPAKRDTAATDELAALRAAAAAAAESTVAARDTTPQRQAGGPRNLNQLNPEISVTGDTRAFVQTEGRQQDNFELHEMEFAFQATLDPYSYTKIFAAVHEGGVEMEEAYFYYTGLPGRLRLDLGLFRQQLGELNRWHLHALPEAGYPLALGAYAGDEGLAGTGASLYWAGSLLGTQELWGQVTLGENEGLFEGGTRPSYLVHLNNFWQLSRSTYAQVGATGVYGTNPDSSLKTRLGAVDVRITWRPPAQALYREWTLRGELLALNKERGGTGVTRLGGYLGSTYRMGRRWVAGMRYDYVEAPEGPRAITRQIVPSLTWWQSEWVYLRAQYAHSLTEGFLAASKQLVLQAVWSIGPHKHETY